MTNKAKIKISEKYSNFLNTRESIESLFNDNNESVSELEFDFSDIQFISRSSADQFHKLKIIFESNNKKITISNANDTVINMLQTVSNTQTLIRRSSEKIQFFNFNETKELEDYLLSI